MEAAYFSKIILSAISQRTSLTVQLHPNKDVARLATSVRGLIVILRSRPSPIVQIKSFFYPVEMGSEKKLHKHIWIAYVVCPHK